jgi:hypothetical protein
MHNSETLYIVFLILPPLPSGQRICARQLFPATSPDFSPIELNKAVFHGITLVRSRSYSQEEKQPYEHRV